MENTYRLNQTPSPGPAGSPILTPISRGVRGPWSKFLTPEEKKAAIALKKRQRRAAKRAKGEKTARSNNNFSEASSTGNISTEYDSDSIASLTTEDYSSIGEDEQQPIGTILCEISPPLHIRPNLSSRNESNVNLPKRRLFSERGLHSLPSTRVLDKTSIPSANQLGDRPIRIPKQRSMPTLRTRPGPSSSLPPAPRGGKKNPQVTISSIFEKLTNRTPFHTAPNTNDLSNILAQQAAASASVYHNGNSDSDSDVQLVYHKFRGKVLPLPVNVKKREQQPPASIQVPSDSENSDSESFTSQDNLEHPKSKEKGKEREHISSSPEFAHQPINIPVASDISITAVSESDNDESLLSIANLDSDNDELPYESANIREELPTNDVHDPISPDTFPTPLQSINPIAEPLSENNDSLHQEEPAQQEIEESVLEETEDEDVYPVGDLGRPDPDDGIKRALSIFLADELLQTSWCDLNAGEENENQRHSWLEDDVRWGLQAGEPIVNMKEFGAQLFKTLGVESFRDFVEDMNPQMPSWIPQEKLQYVNRQNGWQKLMEGCLPDDNEFSKPSMLDLTDITQEPQVRETSVRADVRFDIDSILMFPTSLAVASQGVEFNVIPHYTRNITSDLHITLQMTADDDTVSSRKIAEFMHFQLGQVVGPLKLTLFIMFPHLPIRNGTSNFPTLDILEMFFDKIFLPGIRSCCPPATLQHYPLSFRHAYKLCTAAQVESRSRMTSSYSRIATILYFLQHDYLHDIWVDILRSTQQPGLRQFSDAILFVEGKNLKTFTQKSSPHKCMQTFFNLWESSCCSTYLDPTRVWIDYGKETVPEYIPSESVTATQQSHTIHRPPKHATALWRTCCLQDFRVRLNHLLTTTGIPESKQKFQTEFYNWGMTEEVSNMTISPRLSNPLRNIGLVYAQFYSSSKEIFDSRKIYPFTNDRLEGLAIDPTLRKVAQHGNRGSSWDPEISEAAYLHARDRTLLGLEDAKARSWGVRVEFRVNLDLLFSIYRRLNEDRFETYLSNVDKQKDILGPTWIQPTEYVMDFLAANTLRFVYPFEAFVQECISRNDTTWNQSKAMVMCLRALPGAFGAVSWKRQAAFWHAEVKRRTPNGRDLFPDVVANNDMLYGLGFQESLKKYGYAWISPNRIRYIDGNLFSGFVRSVEKGNFFADNKLLRSYKARWKTVRRLTEEYQEFDLFKRSVLKRDINTEPPHAIKYLNVFLARHCIRTFRRDVWTHIKDFLKPDAENLQKCLAGEIAIDAYSLSSMVLDDYPIRWMSQTRVYRWKLSSYETAKLLWDFDDGQHTQREVWETKPYRTTFRQVCRWVLANWGQDRLRSFKSDFFQIFLTQNPVFPHPMKRWFVPRSKQKDIPGKPYHWHNAAPRHTTARPEDTGFIVSGNLKDYIPISPQIHAPPVTVGFQDEEYPDGWNMLDNYDVQGLLDSLEDNTQPIAIPADWANRTYELYHNSSFGNFHCEREAVRRVSSRRH